MLDLSRLDLEEIADALAGQTDDEHLRLINPETGEVVFWTADTGIDGYTPVEGAFRRFKDHLYEKTRTCFPPGMHSATTARSAAPSSGWPTTRSSKTRRPSVSCPPTPTPTCPKLRL